MLLGIMQYSSNLLREIQKKARNKYEDFKIDKATRVRIIVLGIRKTPIGHPYRWSLAGRNLFYKICKIVTKTLERSKQLKCISPTNLITVSLTKRMNSTWMSLAHINARSIVNKIQPFQQCILDQNIDICAVTETWIKEDDIDIITKEIPPPGYNILLHQHMDGRSGAGLGMVYKDYITISSNKVTKNHNTMEYMRYSLRIKQTSIDICVLYRFPCTSVIDFCSELVSEIEESINLTSNRCVYKGTLTFTWMQIIWTQQLSMISWNVST